MFTLRRATLLRSLCRVRGDLDDEVGVEGSGDAVKQGMVGPTVLSNAGS
jgi:hypothetical protein